ncbi:hypothetical protein CVT24_007180 [Panaeolus cyanescens]|uniref:Yeast cell wall synthesis Kre9/Knh1-like N-terminal domain-containing protein n=1 Tax=Panaeolus cyanescens TaxID=181874 RepID=A0A409VJC8_9AGAR|nr:hypothetical protein CVT24_007180 [Panaeolus cyanescens]
MINARISLSLLAFVAPLVSALTLQIPENPTSGGEVTIKWTSAPGDPETWTFELINTVFNNAFAIANNVNPAPQELRLTLPVVPEGDGYTLEAVDIGDISKVFASTGPFAIGASTASTTPLSTARGTSLTGSQTTSALSRPATGTPSAPSNIVTQSNTAPATSATSPPPTPTPSTGAALSSRVAAPAVVLLSGLAGAAMIAL